MAIQNNNNKYNELTRISLSVSGILLGVTAVAGGVLISQPTRADSSAETEVTVSVSAVCNMEAMSSSTAHTAEITPGTSFTGDIGTTNMKATCNDSGGYDIYAVGYSNSEWKNTNLINRSNNNITISTCAQNDSSCNTNSYWSMKLSEGTGDVATIISPYNTYAAVPNDYTKVATRSSATTGSTNASFTTTYGAYAVTSQTAGNYDGKVKYTLVHPNGAPAPEAKDPSIVLYDAVAAQLKTNSTACSVKIDGKCTQDATGLQAVITTPTSSDPSTDTSNSGVFAYNSTAFGASSDASNDNTIYYFRGILDSNLDNTASTYGSNGDSAYYKNYVRLGDTCWRIFRTTGSGGVKMIYNGSYSGGTTANSCANATTNAQTSVTSQYNATSTSDAKRIVRVGYTYNANYDSTFGSTQAGTLFGTNSSYSGNSTNSIIKGYIENTWYANAIGAYESILEPSAGYCNDRSVNTGGSWTTYSDTTSITTPYTTATSGITAFYFGPYIRNWVSGRTLTLSCPRNVVDLYTTSSASNGNKQLSKPVALVTADEMALSGSGYGGPSSAGSYASNYSYASFLRSGSIFWLLSPGSRGTNGRAYGFYLSTNGRPSSDYVSYAYGVRPSISLTSGTTASSGSGTATDPWVVTP